MIQTAPLYYLFMSVISQILALGATILLARTGILPEASAVVVSTQAAIAFLASRALKLSFPWQMLNLLLLPAMYFFLNFGLPAWAAMLGLVISLIIYVPTFWTRVPFYPTSAPMYDEILRQLPEGKEFSCIDLGCGYGTLLYFLARHRPLGKFYGSEIAPLPFIVAFLRAIPFGQRVKISCSSFWNMDFGSYDFIYAFLAPDPMPKLWEKVKKEAHSGSVFLVNTFKVDARADQEISVQDKHRCVLYVYRR